MNNPFNAPPSPPPPVPTPEDAPEPMVTIEQADPTDDKEEQDG